MATANDLPAMYMLCNSSEIEIDALGQTTFILKAPYVTYVIYGEHINQNSTLQA